MDFGKTLLNVYTWIFGSEKRTPEGNAGGAEEENISRILIINESTTSLLNIAAHTVHTPAVANPTMASPASVIPAENAMFNQLGKVAIYGDSFSQINATTSDRGGFNLLQSRVAPSAFHNSAQRIDPPRCHPDTRVDIIQDIFDWITTSGNRDEWLLWLNGAAGIGKSAIMQSITERCLLEAIAVATFFFFRSDSTRNTMAPLVATLAYQLIQAIPETKDDILLTLEHNPLIFEQSLEFQMQQLLLQPLLRLPTHLRRLFVVFIDGLDECCDRAQQSNLVEVLGNISSSMNIPVIFLIGSRREPQIEADFSQQQVASILKIYPLDDIQASDDIRRFLNAKFKEIKATHPRKRYLSPDWPSSEIVEQIIAKTSGQFIYASVVINYISLPHVHPALQLDVINGIRARSPSLENPFAHLDALYHHIFSQIKELDIVRNILAFKLAMAKTDYYSGDEINCFESLFQLSAGELEVHLAELTAVLVYEITEAHDDKSSSSKIQFLHASLPNFLLDQSRSEEFYIDLDAYTLKLLCMFLERPPPGLDRLLSKNDLTSQSLSRLEEVDRLGAISVLLEVAKTSVRLQHACMNFNYITCDSDMVNATISYVNFLLPSLKRLELEDQAQAYYHVLDVFAAGFAKYWPVVERSNKHDTNKKSPDLVARINQIRRKL